MTKLDRKRLLVVSACTIVWAAVVITLMYVDMETKDKHVNIVEAVAAPAPAPITYYDVSTEDLVTEEHLPVIVEEIEVEEVIEVIEPIEDFELICRLVAAEARGESYEGKKAVAQVVKDRMEHEYKWLGGPTARGVIYKKGQFAKPWSGDLSKYPDIAEAVTAVFAHGERVFEETTIFFYYPKMSTSGGMAPIKRYNFVGEIGCHHFHGDKKIK